MPLNSRNECSKCVSMTWRQYLPPHEEGGEVGEGGEGGEGGSDGEGGLGGRRGRRWLGRR
jgi:hypothetical protein